MSIKQFFILFLILFFVPVFMGKVSFAPFSDFFQHISFSNFITAFTSVFQSDFAFYTHLITPWVGKLIAWIKSVIPAGSLPKISQ